MTECFLCWREAKLDHYVSYEKDETVSLCGKCHYKVHNDPDHKFHPKDRDPLGPTIRITVRQKERLDGLKEVPYEPYWRVVERLLDNIPLQES